MISSCDSLADQCVERLNQIPVDDDADKRPFKKDLYGLLRDHAEEDTKLNELWTEVNTVPEWVDWAQIQRGQDVFFRYGLPILNVVSVLLSIWSMIAHTLTCSIAKLRKFTWWDVRSTFSIDTAYQTYTDSRPRGAIRVVETLSRTGGFGAKVVRRRLLETLQHVLQVNNSAEGMKPGGDGQVSCVRVRLLHSSVRSKILSLIEQNPEYYDIEEYGTPVNDLDCIGTINTFCSSVVWLGLPRQGIYPSQQDIEDYIALWRLVAYYMGTPTEPFESPVKARAMMESLLISEIDPTETGKILAKNIIIGLENTAPAYASKEFMEAMSRLLNGDQLSNELDIPRPNLYYRMLIWGYVFWVMAVSFIVPKIWFLDRMMISVSDATHGLLPLFLTGGIS